MRPEDPTQEYWFYLEPYTFLFRGETCAVVYNSLSSNVFRTNYSIGIIHLLNKLENLDNLYVVEMSEKDLQDKSVREFVVNIRNTFSGDLIAKTSFLKKPVVLPPRLNLQRNINNLIRDTDLSIEQSLPEQLTEISFYITGQCNRSCEYCADYRKQFSFCHKSQHILSLKDISKTLNQASGSSLSRVNILGGDIFEFPEWIGLIELLQCYGCMKVFYVHLNNLNYGRTKEILSIDRTELNILVNGEANKMLIERAVFQLNNYMPQLKWTFVITNESEAEYIDNLITELNLGRCRILPFLHDSNIDFFKNNIFMNEADIWQSNVSKKEIFARETLNSIDYGKLIYTEDEKVYANLNNISIGRIQDDLFLLILKEFEDGESWKKTREELVQCKKCVYKFLCPPPSGYDYFFKTDNVCNLSEYEKGLPDE